MRYKILLFLFVGLLSSCIKDDEATVKPLYTNNPLKTEMDKDINSIVEQYARLSTTGSISIGIFKEGEEYYYGYGETKIGTKTIPDSLTLYEIGSITKTFTALMAIDYLNSNGLSKETPINDLLPSDIPLLEFDGAEIRMKHLLNHTSGLPRLPGDFSTGMNMSNPYKHYDSTKVYNYLKSYHLNVTPGARFEYSNLGMGLVGLILERQLNKSFEQILLNNVCTPLGLSHTKITLNGADSLNFAAGYSQYGIQAHYWDDMNAFKGAGAIRSNAKDLIKYGKCILNPSHTILKNQIEECTTTSFQDAATEMGLGWIKQTYEDDVFFLHDGGTGGFTSLIFISKNRSIVLVLLFSNESTSKVTNLFNPLISFVLLN